MNEQIIDSQDSVEMKSTRKPLHLSIVSIGAFLLISLVLLVMMDMFITALAENLAISHAGVGPTIEDAAVETYVLAVRSTAIICLAASIAIGFFWRKIYLYKPGRILQKLLMLAISFMIIVMFGLGIGLIVAFAFFLWDPTRLADWSPKSMKLYRYGVLGTLLVAIAGEFFRMGLVTLMVMGLSSLLLIIFILFYWTPEFSANWVVKKLQIYRIIALALIGVYAIVGWMTISSALGAYPMTPFWIVALSGFLTPLGAGVVSLAPLLLVVIPLYLFFPKVIRDLWNLRPSIETFWREFLYHPMGILGMIIIGTIVCIALFAPYIAPYYWSNPAGDPILLDQLLQPPSPEHILGTNHRGEDIFSRIIYGSQISLMIGFAASLVAVFLGTAVGLIAGYYGGILDMILMRITDVFLCLPTLPLMLIFLMLFGQGLQNVIVVIAILGWTGTARMVRSEALSLRERPLTEAAHALGASDGYILIHHILPNTLPLILANMILGVVTAILSEAGIAFLGFVDIHGQPSWGIVLHWAWKNAALLANKWWWFIPPGVLIMLTTLGFVFISHTADKVVNPRLRGRR
ncbi:MAG: ABC transporter permease [Candidatus Thorarchaeota archaeon]